MTPNFHNDLVITKPRKILCHKNLELRIRYVSMYMALKSKDLLYEKFQRSANPRLTVNLSIRMMCVN